MLEQRRERLTETELDHVHRRVTASRPAAESSSPRRSAAMRSRAAITSMLAAGFLMTSGGAALGVSALSETHSANAAQYGTAAGTQGSGGVAGATAAGGNNPNAGAGERAGGTLGGGAQGAGSDRSEVPPTATAQAPRQLEAGESELPFTGYLSGFVLLAGLGTLAAGLVLRRGTRQALLQS